PVHVIAHTQRGQRPPSAHAHRQPLHHVRPARGDHHVDVDVEQRTRHHRARRVPGAEHHEVRHRPPSLTVVLAITRTLRGMTVDIRRATDRFHTELDWLDSWHSFSFSSHYDPANTHHGLLLVNNDDTVRAGGGFGTHPHRDMEIVTWVLDGELHHRDSAGHDGIIYPGLAQRMS